MYVIATVSCPNFHFSVSPHVPFLKLLFEQIANSNEYLLAKFGFDTAENELRKDCPLFAYRSPRYVAYQRVPDKPGGDTHGILTFFDVIGTVGPVRVAAGATP